MSISATDKSVRDHPQKATIKGDEIIITMMTGRHAAGKYTIPVSAWEATKRGPTANENYNRFSLITNAYRGNFTADYDHSPCQADRLVGSQIAAIKKAMQKLEVA